MSALRAINPKPVTLTDFLQGLQLDLGLRMMCHFIREFG